jgi:hypothetical protein
VCALSLALAGCNSRGNPSQTNAVPHISFESTSHDFGAVREGDRLKYTFRIANTGSAPLRILRVDPSRSCAVAKPPELVAPSASADLEVACNTEDRPNRLADRIVVHSDDPLKAEVVLGIDAQVEPILAFASRTVDLKMPFGQMDSQEVRLTGRLATSARLEVRAIDPPGPDVSVFPAEHGKPGGLRLSMTGVRVGRVAGQVLLATGVQNPKELTILYSWQVLGNLTVEPTNPFVDLRGPGSGSVGVKVSSSRHDFRLDDAQVTEGPFEASFAPDVATHGYAVQVRVVASRVPEGQRGLTGTLRLISNDPAEPQKDVPLFAMGAL